MIFLRKIYSEPSGLFDLVEFKEGINIIYAGYKDEPNEKGSLNSVGKSTLVKLINFCLMSSYDKRNDLYRAKNITDSYFIVLEIDIYDKRYVIKRSTRDQNTVIFGVKGEEKKYKLQTIKKHLCSLFFDDNEYAGRFHESWFRKIIPFFLRDEFKGYNSPIDFIGGQSDLNMIPYNLFLLGLDNRLSLRNQMLRSQLKEKQKAKKEITNIVHDRYSIDVEDVNSKLDTIEEDIKEVKQSLDSYQLDFTYLQLQEELDKLTKKVKGLIKSNQIDKDKLEKYKANIYRDYNISTDKVAEMYRQLDEELGFNVKKSLDEIIEFKDKLVSSRTKFLNNEIQLLEESIKERKMKIRSYSERRSELLKRLDEQDTFKDITNVVEYLNEKNKELADVNGKVAIYNDIQEDILSIKSSEAALDIKINKFIKQNQSKISDIRKTFNQVYNALYNDNKGIFNITYSSKRKDAKFDIKAQAPDSTGWGKSRASILIYDLTILINAIRQERRFPRFLIHDGIFNGVFKGQFISTIDFLNRLLTVEDLNFQYIFTANESDIWLKAEELDKQLDGTKITFYNDTNRIFGEDFD